MRRRSQGVTYRDEFLAERIAKLERDDPERVIRALEPFVTERRRQRLEAMIDRAVGGALEALRDAELSRGAVLELERLAAAAANRSS